jgi:hypothetical protein
MNEALHNFKARQGSSSVKVTLTSGDALDPRPVFDVKSGKLHEHPSWLVLGLLQMLEDSGVTVRPREVR